ncbi:diacylglycerol kinase [Psychrobacter faecalis]|uniref:Diacylglycerol kinase n=1 Tax=Psychrobacter faecalis TaxID=180588 RepID=A0ABT9HJ06_9GAMM|nr:MULTISPECIES: diacylglycerol kinase [Psychrobacter]MDP4545756.1 diacylglycerol kinase [Psychrobacter faecalis]HAV47591.1 diacylglycerol kinase [Psychrobacter sp.]
MSTIKSTSPDNEPLSHDGNDPINASELLPPDNFASKVKGKKGLARLLKATGYSIEGFKAAYKFEAAFRQVVWLNLALLMVITLIPFGVASKMLLVTASFLSLIVELINTAIEASVDHTSTEQHPLAKIAKDTGSAAQSLALLLLVILWLLALSNL